MFPSIYHKYTAKRVCLREGVLDERSVKTVYWGFHAGVISAKRFSGTPLTTPPIKTLSSSELCRIVWIPS